MRSKESPEDVRIEKRDLLKANKAGLLTKDVWVSYPETMLRYRAINECIKFFAPEALGGVAMYEEVKDIPVENYIEPQVKKEASISVITEGDTMEGFNDFVG